MLRHSWAQFKDRSLSKWRRMTPVLKPLLNAGHGRCFFQSLPKYQSLWFSTRPKACNMYKALKHLIKNHGGFENQTKGKGHRKVKLRDFSTSWEKTEFFFLHQKKEKKYDNFFPLERFLVMQAIPRNFKMLQNSVKWDCCSIFF